MTTLENSGTNFSLKNEIQKLEDSPRRDLNIIALYFEERKPDLRSKEQLAIALKRHLRAAQDLKPFTDAQILSAVKKAKDFVPGWTLETLLKILTK
jgi:hypothetical protein